MVQLLIPVVWCFPLAPACALCCWSDLPFAPLAPAHLGCGKLLGLLCWRGHASICVACGVSTCCCISLRALCSHYQPDTAEKWYWDMDAEGSPLLLKSAQYEEYPICCSNFVIGCRRRGPLDSFCDCWFSCFIMRTGLLFKCNS
ncbi:unnamed protein product [Amoebophrya sp. A25]|nr:unnamed protein product [Amoebophrya sp. A25]|eukprot:GSA25T00024649001.1